MAMRSLSILASLCVCLCGPSILFGQEEAPAEKPAEEKSEEKAEKKAEEKAEKAPAKDDDAVFLKDGSVIKGEVMVMTGGTLTIKRTNGDEVTVKWEEVQGIRSSKNLRLIFGDESAAVGSMTPGEPGKVLVKEQSAAEPTTRSLEAVTAINPPKVRPVTYRGNVNVGASVSDGNTNDKDLRILGEFIARSKRQRLSFNGLYNYEEDEGDLKEREGRFGLKYDFFITKRLYAFTHALLEKDEAEQLDLRSALSAGAGLQFIDRGDFQNDYFKNMELYGEAGVAFFSEDFETGEDDQFTAARWAVGLDWPIPFPRMTFFHKHQGYPGLENLEDLYILTETGVRVNLVQDFIATLQVNWEWDNTPARGEGRSDTDYLLTLGYSFEF